MYPDITDRITSENPFLDDYDNFLITLADIKIPAQPIKTLQFTQDFSHIFHAGRHADFSKKSTYSFTNNQTQKEIPKPFAFNYVNEPHHLSATIILCTDCKKLILDQLQNGTKISLKLILYIWDINKLSFSKDFENVVPSKNFGQTSDFQTTFRAMCSCSNSAMVTRELQVYKGKVFNINSVNNHNDEYVADVIFHLTNSERITFLKKN